MLIARPGEDDRAEQLAGELGGQAVGSDVVHDAVVRVGDEQQRERSSSASERVIVRRMSATRSVSGEARMASTLNRLAPSEPS